MNSDETYILDLCDEVLGRVSRRQHRFFFLRGDTGRRLPVDAFYPGINLVVEYRERQDVENALSFARPPAASAVSHDIQRGTRDERLRAELAKRGIRLVELDVGDFLHDPRRRLLRRIEKDAAIIRSRLAEARKQAVSKRRIGASAAGTPSD